MNPYYAFWKWAERVWHHKLWRRRFNKLDAFYLNELNNRSGSRAAVDRVLQEAGYPRAVVFEDRHMLLIHIECANLTSSTSYVEQRVKAVIPAGVAVVVYPSTIHAENEGILDQIMWIQKVFEEEDESAKPVRSTVRAEAPVGVYKRSARTNKRNRPTNANRHKKAVSSGRKRVGRGRAPARPSSHNNRRGKNASDRP